MPDSGGYRGTDKNGAENVKRIKALPYQVLSDFCSQLSAMLSSGIGLLRAMEILIKQPGLKVKYQLIYSEVSNDLKAGKSLSESLENCGGAFPEMLSNMTASAEVSGNLSLTLGKMGRYYDKLNRLNKRIAGAMVYPKLLTVIAVIAMFFIVSYVVPQFQSMFDMIEELPIPTAIVLGLSSFISEYWYIIIIIVVSLKLIWDIVKKLPAIRYALDWLVLRLPIAGKLLSTIYTARFADTLSSLYSGGIPITDSLTTARSTIGNYYIENQFEALLDEIKAGGLLSETLLKVDGFDTKLASVVAVGEESGRLGDMLTSVSERLDYESDQAISRLMALIEPIMIVIMAAVIGFIMIAVMLPMLDFYSAIDSYQY